MSNTDSEIFDLLENHFQFDDVIKEVVEHKDNAGKEIRSGAKPQNRFAPSSAGKCIRLQWFNHADQTTEPDDDLKRIFYHGHLIHDDFAYPILKYWLKKVMKSKNFTVINEFPFNYKIPMGRYMSNKIYYNSDDIIESNGYIDNVIQFFDQGVMKHIPIEIKSFSGNLRQLNQPYFDAYIQLMSYLGYLKAKFGYIVYITKSNIIAKTFKVEFDRKIFNMILKRAKTLHHYKITGDMPPAEARLEFEKGNSWWTQLKVDDDGTKMKHPCNSCEFDNFCKENPLEIKAEQDNGEW